MPPWARITLCFSLAGILLGIAAGLFWLTAISFGAALIPLIAAVLRLFRPNDPYNLAALRQVQERADWELADEMEIDDEADIVCPNCGTVYGSVRLICPNCRK